MEESAPVIPARNRAQREKLIEMERIRSEEEMDRNDMGRIRSEEEMDRKARRNPDTRFAGFLSQNRFGGVFVMKWPISP